MVICPGPGELTDHLTALGCPVAHIPLHPVKLRTLSRIWDSSRRIRALVRDRAIDILAPDAPRDALTCGIAKSRTHAKLVWFVRLTRHDPLDPLLERLADGFIGDSDATRRRFSSSPRVTARYRTIVGGADLERFRPAADRTALRRELGIPEDRFVLLFVGQVTRPKGVMDIVEAFTLLRVAPERPRPLLILVGTPHPPEIAGEIESQEDVRLLGQREDVHRWMQAADVLVSGSHQDTEGMSRVLYEAMACGAVPIATDIAGNRDAVTPETGLLVPQRSPDAIARAVASLRKNPDRLAALRSQGMRRARETFDIRLHARGVEMFYRQLVPLRASVGESA